MILHPSVVVTLNCFCCCTFIDLEVVMYYAPPPEGVANALSLSVCRVPDPKLTTGHRKLKFGRKEAHGTGNS